MSATPPPNLPLVQKTWTYVFQQNNNLSVTGYYNNKNIPVYYKVSYKSASNSINSGWYTPDQYLTAYDYYMNNSDYLPDSTMIDPVLYDPTFVNGLTTSQNVNLYNSSYLPKMCNILTTSKNYPGSFPSNCPIAPVPLNPIPVPLNPSNNRHCNMNGMITTTTSQLIFTVVSLICVIAVLISAGFVCKYFKVSSDATLAVLLGISLVLGGVIVTVLCV